MPHKCIEPEFNCYFRQRFGENWYCGLSHKPNHKWGKDADGTFKMLEECAEDDAKNYVPRWDDY